MRPFTGEEGPRTTQQKEHLEPINSCWSDRCSTTFDPCSLHYCNQLTCVYKGVRGWVWFKVHHHNLACFWPPTPKTLKSKITHLSFTLSKQKMASILGLGASLIIKPWSLSRTWHWSRCVEFAFHQIHLCTMPSLSLDGKKVVLLVSKTGLKSLMPFTQSAASKDLSLRDWPVPCERRTTGIRTTQVNIYLSIPLAAGFGVFCQARASWSDGSSVDGFQFALAS